MLVAKKEEEEEELGVGGSGGGDKGHLGEDPEGCTAVAPVTGSELLTNKASHHLGGRT